MIQSSSAQLKNLEDLLHRMTDRIRQSLELPEILEATVDEMRRFLKTDRVKVYQFHEDGSGEVVAESIKDQQLPSLLGQHFPAEDIPPNARELFLTARQRSIINVSKQEIGISPLLNSDTRKALLNRIDFRRVDPCHVEYLTAMGVQASLVVPIIHHHRLWGLLVAHHSVPKRFGHRELEIVQLVADQVAVAIAHATLLTLTRLQGQRESIINQTVSYLHSTVKNPLKRALKHMVTALDCSGGRLYIPAKSIPTKHFLVGHSPSESVPFEATHETTYAQTQVVTTGTQPRMPKVSARNNKLTKLETQAEAPALEKNILENALENVFDWRIWLKKEASNQILANLWTFSDINHSQMPTEMLAALSHSQIRSVLVAKLIHRNRFLGYLSLFRHTADVEVVWAGRLETSDSRQSRPRQSFEAWKEIKKEQPIPWTSQDIGLAQDLADQFASVIHQTQLYRRVQTLNADLEARVAQRTKQLQIINRDLKQEIAEKEHTLKALQDARDSLERVGHQNELILNAAGEGIYGIDLKGKIVFVNPAAVNILECQKKAIIGSFMHDFLRHTTPEGAPYRWENSPIFSTLKHGKTHHVAGEWFMRQNGSKFPVEYVSTCIQEKGRIIGAVVLFQDITARQAIETMRDEFIAVVSHELRTPLTSIRAALGLLAQKDLNIPADQRQRMVEIASSNTNRLVRLVSDILDVERIKLGKITLNKRRCNLSEIMVQASDEMRAMAEKHNIHLSISPFSVRLYADPDRIIQTLTNLLSNAIKFSAAGSTVQVIAQQIDAATVSQVQASLNKKGKVALQDGLEMVKSLILIQVIDQGPGIPENKLEIIFDQFEQLNTTDANHKGGTGLGLAICRNIVQQHHGAIWTQSKAGQGSTFFFTLPVAETEFA